MNTSLKILNQTGSESCAAAVRLNIHAAQRPQAEFLGRAAIVTLGCAKNQVDSEVMLGVLRNQGYEITSDLTRADVVVVNTCGFLQASAKESIDCILNLADLKKSARLKHLVVVGCLVERYGEELKNTLPEVDSFITTDQILRVGQAAQGEFTEELKTKGRPYFLYDDQSPRELSNSKHYAYVKIAEGCDRPCTFCIIPKIRGAMRSRSTTSLVNEVVILGQQGVREINLIAQDLTSYARDRRRAHGESGNLASLLHALDATKAVPWIRLLYCYPVGTGTELLSSMLSLPSICEYIDIPLQHSSERILKAMRRPLGRFAPRPLVEMIKGRAPDIHLRSTFIVGFPGETEKDIKDLEDFIATGYFTHLGVFSFSKEEGTPAASLKKQLPQKEKDARRDHLMRIQRKVSAKRLKTFIGKRLPVLVEGLHPETELLLCARTRFQAPEVDGHVIINDVSPDMNLEQLTCGSIIEVEITESSGYDLVAKIVSPESHICQHRHNLA